MEEYIIQIKQIEKILEESKKIEEKEQRKKYLESKLPEFYKFKNSLSIILSQFQFKEMNSPRQNKISEILKRDILELLNIQGVFEESEAYKYFKSDLLDALSFNESKFAYNLQYEKGMEKIESALKYLLDRQEYVNAIRENNYFEGEDLNEGSATKFAKEEFAQNLYGHILIQIKRNFLTLPEDDIISIIQQIDETTYFNEVLQKKENKMNFYEKNLIYQYAETVIRMKSIFTPDKLKDDIAIKQMWNGKIQDEKTIRTILNNLSTKSFLDISEYNMENGLINGLVEHFRSVKMSEKNIALIMEGIIESGSLKYEIANFLAKIDIPNTYEEFINSQHSVQNEWLSYCKVFTKLKSAEKEIEDARNPFLPAEYYVKKIDKIFECSNISTNFIKNLYTLMETDYYTEEEKQMLNEALSRNAIIQNFQPTEQERKEQDTVKKYISNFLRVKKGIDIEGKVFFGNGHNTHLGYYDPNKKAIWLDENLIKQKINSQDIKEKIAIYKTMFHEMHHAVQYDNIEKGKIDYLTYNFIKEDIIEEYDMEYYSENYKSIYMESDARKEEIIGALELLKEINPEIVEYLKKDMEYEYVKESRTHTVYKDAEKSFSIGKNSKINVSDYVGRLIKNNPQILTEKPILSIEYNRDGTRKDIQTLLKQFEEHKKDEENYKNLYSIYYGIIQNSVKGDETDELKEQIEQFMQGEQELVSMEDMHNCYHSVDLSNIKQLYLRLFSITRNKTNKTEVKREVSTDDNEAR